MAGVIRALELVIAVVIGAGVTTGAVAASWQKFNETDASTGYFDETGLARAGSTVLVPIQFVHKKRRSTSDGKAYDESFFVIAVNCSSGKHATTSFKHVARSGNEALTAAEQVTPEDKWSFGGPDTGKAGALFRAACETTADLAGRQSRYGDATSWQYYGENQSIAAYFDGQSIRRESGVLLVDVRNLNKRPRVEEDNGGIYTESRLTLAMDCGAGKSATVATREAAPSGSGMTTIWEAKASKEKWKFNPSQAGSIRADLQNMLCDDPSKDEVFAWKATGLMVQDGFHYWSPKLSQPMGVAGLHDVILHELLRFSPPLPSGGKSVYAMQFVRLYNCVTGDFTTNKSFAYLSPDIFGSNARAQLFTINENNPRAKGRVPSGSGHGQFLAKYCGGTVRAN
jgi:hypothetical protein